AASAPQIPGPHSATLRYSSRMRSLESASSSDKAVTASLTLRRGLRDADRYRFFASCWVMVLAPRSRSRCRHRPPSVASHPLCPFTPSASAISAGSIPRCVRKRESSPMITMRWSSGEISCRALGRTVGHADSDCPSTRQSARRRIIAVSRGQCSRHHTGGGHTPMSHASAMAANPSAQRPSFLRFASAMGTLDLSTLRRRLQQALGDEFTVGTLLGEGGFAAVFRVHDTALNRDVAIKVLDLGLTPSPALAERFVREARTLAHLEHANLW